MSKKHHMTKREYNSQKTHHRTIKRERDPESDAIQEDRISHGKLRERNLIQTTHHIRSLSDLEDDFIDMIGGEDEMSA